MNPTSTLRLRNVTSALFLGWALLGIVLSLAALRHPADRLEHPFDSTLIGGTALVSGIADTVPDSARVLDLWRACARTVAGRTRSAARRAPYRPPYARSGRRACWRP